MHKTMEQMMPTSEQSNHSNRFDALLPHEMAAKAETIGVRKATMRASATFVLAVLAGAFIALGAVFSTTVTSAAERALPFGIARLAGGVAFCLGLVLVVVGGAELFTGNNLIVMAWASGKVATRRLLHNWAIVFAGNFLGALATAVLMFASGQFRFGSGVIGRNALDIALSKTSFGFVQAVCLGILCNGLVCLAVWLCYSARSAADKIVCVVFPISAFVTAGFEHSVANMYFIPIAMLIKTYAPQAFWSAIGKSEDDYASIDTSGFLLGNLLPVTLGNVIGGAVMVGLVYWFVYLRSAIASDSRSA